jgi:hypothetical protein
MAQTEHAHRLRHSELTQGYDFSGGQNVMAPKYILLNATSPLTFYSAACRKRDLRSLQITIS